MVPCSGCWEDCYSTPVPCRGGKFLLLLLFYCVTGFLPFLFTIVLLCINSLIALTLYISLIPLFITYPDHLCGGTTASSPARPWFIIALSFPSYSPCSHTFCSSSSSYFMFRFTFMSFGHQRHGLCMPFTPGSLQTLLEGLLGSWCIG